MSNTMSEYSEPLCGCGHRMSEHRSSVGDLADCRECECNSFAVEKHGKNPRSGEPMKTVMELANNWKERIEKPEEITALMTTQAKAAFRLAMMRSVDELEAWLREVDNAVHESNLSSGARLWIRQRIFGTIPMSTTQEGK